MHCKTIKTHNTMKKATFLLVLMATGLAAAAQHIQYDVDSVSIRKVGQLYFHITSRNTAELTYMLCPNGVCDWYPDTVVVPPSVTIDGHEYTVNRIGDGAVNRGDRVRSFTMPETITEIGNKAFHGLGINITLPESVRSIGAEAFPTNNPPANIRIPRNVEHIDEAAFYGSNIIRFTVDSANRHFVAVDSVALCNADTTLLLAYVNSDTLPHYTLPSTIRRIGKGAFFTCRSLRTLTLPNGLREMGDCILYGTPLSSLHIPATVCRIEGAPRNVPSANFDLTVDPASTHYRMEDNQLMSYDGDTLIQVLGATGDYTVPNGVRVLAPGLFYRNTTLGTVHLPNGLTAIGEKAFYHSTANVQAPTSIQSIGEMAFYSNSGTTRLNLPNLTHLGASAFEYSNINTLDSTLQLTTIPRRAFYQSKLAKFSFGNQWQNNPARLVETDWCRRTEHPNPTKGNHLHQSCRHHWLPRIPLPFPPLLRHRGARMLRHTFDTCRLRLCALRPPRRLYASHAARHHHRLCRMVPARGHHQPRHPASHPLPQPRP